MKVVPLPAELPGELDLAALNRELCAGRATLDWSDVQRAPMEVLVQLLDGLDLLDDALGLETLPLSLQEDVVHALGESEWLEQALTPTPSPTRGEGNDRTGAWGSQPRAHGAGQPRRPAQSEQESPPSPLVGEGGWGDEGPPPPILTPPSSPAIRDELQKLVLQDLLGPAGGPEEEVDEARVSERYLVGTLAPKRRPVNLRAEDDFALAGDDTGEDGSVDADTMAPGTMFPASLGLSFCVDGAATALRVAARWGRYERTRSEYATTETGEPKRVWKRVPMEGEPHELKLEPGDLKSWAPVSEWEVYVEGRAYRRGDCWMVTLFLVNEQDEPKQSRDTAWLFQPELVIESPDGNAIFRPRPHLPSHTNDDAPPTEEHAMDMLYRHQLEFAVGHGVAVHADAVSLAPQFPREGVNIPETTAAPPLLPLWEKGVGGMRAATRLTTRVVPTYDVPQTTPPTREEAPWLHDLTLDMSELATLDMPALVRSLSTLPAAYAEWIAAQRSRVDDPAAGLDGFHATAAAALERCAETCARIRAGIDLLETDANAADAFRFANRAMARQRVHTLLAQAVRRGGKPALEEIDVPANRSWYVFQLAFILLNLPGITDLHHPDRGAGPDATADLLWFPTGGGKTEAYLGLTAYTLALRRLQGTIAGHAGDYGVAVLMRYTLRLLTLQQFQRATALICACETIRREALAAGDARWGSQPFRIGLWVGRRPTPNSTNEADEAIKRAHGQFKKGGALGAVGSPAQLKSCPWCWTSIDPGRDITVERYPAGRGRTLIYCGDPLGRCPFSERGAPGEGLPVLVVDEEIYRLLPALLISTVDKFAQMPWRGEVEMLFGRVGRRCERHGFRAPGLDDSEFHPASPMFPAARTVDCPPARPPDLIIQDELHLISGPLGTLVGLYETAVDDLASWEVDGRCVRPKVIASTATIRRAPDQVHGLFLRAVSVFPPHGLDIGDNFFARQRPPSEAYPGRRYIGICASGRRLKAVLIRVYVAYLAAGEELYHRYGRAADPWMTLVGYFNALRELGGMRRLVDDDVRNRLAQAEKRGLPKRRPPEVEELTSRKGSTDIPNVLDRLEIPFDPDADRLRRTKAGRGLPRPIDVLLATNMISVGVDVSRLGLMVVGGQPKTTAEYIQATSRVGRSVPGLVCTVYNWTRPRDLSHYERFEHYHATFYEQVEPLSVTPFAPRALDRALSALLVSLVRLQGEEWNANLAAGAIEPGDPVVQAALTAICRRAREVTGRPDVERLVRDELQERLDFWVHEARTTTGGRRLGYRAQNDGVTIGLLQPPALDRWGEFTCLTSLRDVEPEINLILQDGGLDDADS